MYKKSQEPVLSIDGNFGLCRKVAAGKSVRDPLHNETGLFCQQISVDEFVKSYEGHDRNDEVYDLNTCICTCF